MSKINISSFLIVFVRHSVIAIRKLTNIIVLLELKTREVKRQIVSCTPGTPKLHKRQRIIVFKNGECGSHWPVAVLKSSKALIANSLIMAYPTVWEELCKGLTSGILALSSKSSLFFSEYATE